MTQKVIKKAVQLANGADMPVMGLGTLFMKDAKVIENSILKAGYRNIDTATIAMNEKEIGVGMKAALDSSELKRDDLFVAAKLWHKQYFDPETQLRKSLQALQLDYVDIYYIHWPNNFFTDRPLPMHVLWQRMEGLVDKGLCRGIGVSNFNTQLLADILTYARHTPLVNQINLNPYCVQGDLVKFLMDHEIMPVAYSPLGRIGAKMGPKTDDMRELPLIKDLAKKYGKSET